MNTLIIYDNLGRIYHTQTGNFDIPEGLNFLVVDVPPNSYPIKVNVDGASPYVEYGYHPKSELEVLRELVEAQESAILELAEFIAGGGQ